MRDELLLGIDVGTTSVKGSAYNLTGDCVFSQSLQYPTPKSGRPGWVEQNPEDWMDCIKEICAEADRTIGDGRIGGLGLTSQVNTHVFVDAAGEPLMEAITWQDQRCADSAAKLDLAISDDLREKCWGESFKPDPSFLMSRAQWVFDQRLEIWQKTRWILSPKDFCLMRLTNQVASDAISSIGLVDSRGQYLSEAFQLIDGLEDKLPPLRDFGSVVGQVDSNVIPTACPAVVGTMDAWASLFGSGVSKHGDAFQVSGTSEIIGVISNDNVETEGVVTFPPLTGWYLHAGPTQMGGDSVRWFADFMEFDDVEEVFNYAEASIAEQNPMIFLPHIMGERAPLWDPAAKGAFVGLNRDHTISNVAKSVLEGVGFSTRLLLESLEKAAGLQVETIRLSGGGSRSSLWTQIKADIMNRPIQKLVNIDTGTFGAALIAGVGSGLYENIEQAGRTSVKIEREFIPDAAMKGYYDDLYGLFNECYISLKNVNMGFKKMLRD